MIYAPAKRKLTADEYQRMGEDGILRADERVELLDGDLYVMPPIGDGHVGGVISLTHFCGQRIGERALVSVQNPIRLSDLSEPEPDIVLLRPRTDFYRTRKATPDDVLLLVEVADSSIDYDRLTKRPRYAAAGILEVWIVNLIDDRVEVYRQPAGDMYATHTVHLRGDTLTPVALPDLTISVQEILGQT